MTKEQTWQTEKYPKPWRLLLVERDINHFYGDNFPASHVSKNRRVVVFPVFHVFQLYIVSLPKNLALWHEMKWTVNEHSSQSWRSFFRCVGFLHLSHAPWNIPVPWLGTQFSSAMAHMAQKWAMKPWRSFWSSIIHKSLMYNEVDRWTFYSL